MIQTTNDQRKKLFWIEDDALLGTILSREFSKTEFDITQVKTGEEALVLLKDQVPDVILIDLLLPGGISGFDLLKEISVDPRFKSVPKIILSNLSKPADIEKAKKLGADKFMVKADSSLERVIKEIRSEIV